ncbi:MAG TPA: hypothetical protein VF345_02585 [Chthoniobacterales bacterium]
MKLLREWLVIFVLLFIAGLVRADEPRTLVKGTPRILGREIEQLVLTVPIQVGGRQIPGMITMPSFDILPNRFVAASENSEGVYYQAVAQFRPGQSIEGGLWVSKTTAGLVTSYVGDARNLRLQLRLMLQLAPEDVLKLELGRSERRR